MEKRHIRNRKTLTLWNLPHLVFSSSGTIPVSSSAISASAEGFSMLPFVVLWSGSDWFTSIGWTCSALYGRTVTVQLGLSEIMRSMRLSDKCPADDCVQLDNACHMIPNKEQSVKSPIYKYMLSLRESQFNINDKQLSFSVLDNHGRSQSIIHSKIGIKWKCWWHHVITSS